MSADDRTMASGLVGCGALVVAVVIFVLVPILAKIVAIAVAAVGVLCLLDALWEVILVPFGEFLRGKR